LGTTSTKWKTPSYVLIGKEKRGGGITKWQSKYSPLDQINTQNVGKIKLAWTWDSPKVEQMSGIPALQSGVFEAIQKPLANALWLSGLCGKAVFAQSSNTDLIHKKFTISRLSRSSSLFCPSFSISISISVGSICGILPVGHFIRISLSSGQECLTDSLS
jgi:hypothetical protein